MFFKQFYDEDLAQGSYFIGCQATGEAIVVDARRDIDVYVQEAATRDMKITAVTETHIHADYLSGSRELAAATGATLYLSDEGNQDWKYGFEGVKLYDGSQINIGNIIIEAAHTPGHTPEHLSFLVTDGGATDKPGFYLTGDFVFVGDIGRPDLLDEAAGGVDTRFVGAKQLFASLRDKFLNLPDYIQVWPAHGAGSACGKSLGAVPNTTVGYERTVAWWSGYLANNDEEGFTKALLEGQPDAPLYFGRMKRDNKAGPVLLGDVPELKEYDAGTVSKGITEGNMIFVDTRDRASYLGDHVPGSLFIPWGGSFTTYASYVILPESDTRNIVLLANDQDQANEMRDALIRVGIDNVVGYVTSTKDFDTTEVTTISPAELAAKDDAFVLDVRTANEYAEGHIDGATQLHAGRVVYKRDSLPQDQTMVVHCQAGGRASVAASALRHFGFEVLELEGSYEGWQAYQNEQTVPA